MNFPDVKSMCVPQLRGKISFFEALIDCGRRHTNNPRLHEKEQAFLLLCRDELTERTNAVS